MNKVKPLLIICKKLSFLLRRTLDGGACWPAAATEPPSSAVVLQAQHPGGEFVSGMPAAAREAQQRFHLMLEWHC
eukprot:923620-Rhodomonas_salina.4